ncbi:toll/interleukin-1 receptor domain-containing protein [Cryobacterium sp. TMB1-7]|uniref:toll/interleukin-1 receptor domain-containing protein n=1 Tax=Cryobacterium sp. TMB1-7 TaxID=2555866 RepID=UPI00106D391E|nr:toll/interleukin-1 receptor domain-containing protein [Cryobacterium sp. TMB1-7]TFC58242.1 toll/interleukin-1 receptor domain-containing protein [Cryobacterium sp. TMB1-7]
MADKHVFLSYLREDKEHVDALQAALESADFTVWRDTKDLWPGDNWEIKIREAINNGSLTFLACFSTALGKREVSYQYAELMLAAEEYRLRPMDTSWLMTARFDECEIPPVDLGGGRHLNKTIHRVDLFGAQYVPQLTRLITAIHRVSDASPGVPSPAVLESVAGARRAEGNDVEGLRALIRNPSLTMDYDEHISVLGRNLVGQMQDRERFPIADAGNVEDGKPLIRAWVARMTEYEVAVAPALEQIKLLAMYAQRSHAQGLAQLMKVVGQEGIQTSGINLYRHSHQYPALILTYAAGLGALVKNDFDNFRAATIDAVITIQGVRLPFIAQSGGFAVVDENWIGSLFVRASDGTEASDDLIDGLKSRRIGSLHTPISDRIYTLLAPVFQSSFVNDDDYAQAFDRVEVLFDAIAEDARLTIDRFHGGQRGYGRYTWRHQYGTTPPEQVLLAELTGATKGWTPLLAGMFGGDLERAKAALETVCENAKYLRSRRY